MTWFSTWVPRGVFVACVFGTYREGSLYILKGLGQASLDLPYLILPGPLPSRRPRTRIPMAVCPPQNHKPWSGYLATVPGVHAAPLNKLYYRPSSTPPLPGLLLRLGPRPVFHRCSGTQRSFSWDFRIPSLKRKGANRAVKCIS